MNDRDLKVFEAVARTGGIGRAAAELNTVQSAVTARLRQLEEELGVTLFDRHSRGVTLTAAGQRLRPFAARITDLMRQARQAAQDDGRPRGPLSIGSMETTAGLRLPDVLTAYTQVYPDVDLSLTTGTTPWLTQAVLERRLDGAFVAGPVDHPELAAETIFAEEMAIATAPTIGGLGDLQGLADLKIITFRSDCAYRQRLETILSAQGIAKVKVIEIGTLDGIIGCVAAGMGISLLPKGVLLHALRDRRVRTFRPPAWTERIDTVFIRRVDAHPSSALAAFLQIARPTPAAEARGAEPLVLAQSHR
ncbi:LysR family transcriptional regulator [Inquilinus limosus]|uniref:LysR family transcriptional regulator n=1 Tax=Inquilinus limosus TaxID=171674 RepID=UPI003F15D3DA